jgi:hypothetical protein
LDGTKQFVITEFDCIFSFFINVVESFEEERKISPPGKLLKL